MLWDISKKFWVLIVTCDGVYNKQTLHGFFIEGIDVFIRSTMRRGWADKREEIIEGLIHQTRFLLNLPGGQRSSTTKRNGAWTVLVRRTRKEPRESGRPLRVMAVKDTGLPCTSGKYTHTLEHT